MPAVHTATKMPSSFGFTALRSIIIDGRDRVVTPITLVLALARAKKQKSNGAGKINMKKIFPFFILFFIGASIITTIAVSCGVSADVFDPLKTLSKFLIVMAMAAIGMNTNIVKLVKSGAKPIFLGFCCWISITGVSLLLQHVMGLV